MQMPAPDLNGLICVGLGCKAVVLPAQVEDLQRCISLLVGIDVKLPVLCGTGRDCPVSGLP